MRLLGKNIQIYQIIGKKSTFHNSTEFTVHKNIPYSQQITSNKVFLVNELPFRNYKVGDYLGMGVERNLKTFSQKVWHKTSWSMTHIWEL